MHALVMTGVETTLYLRMLCVLCVLDQLCCLRNATRHQQPQWYFFVLCRVRILDELEPGALYSLWKASMGQYVLDDTRKAQCFESYIIWDDFPTQPGQVRRDR